MQREGDSRQSGVKQTREIRCSSCFLTKIIRSLKLSCIYMSVVISLFSGFTEVSALASQEEAELVVPEGYLRYTSSDGSMPIPDMGTVTSMLTISDKGFIKDIDVQIYITHPFNDDLDIYLIAPDETRIELATDIEPSGYGYFSTIFDDDADLAIAQGSQPFFGRFRPEGQLFDLFDKSMMGIWTLEVSDDSESGTGELISWSLIIRKKLCPPVVRSEPRGTGETCESIFLDDVGTLTTYEVNVPQSIPEFGILQSQQIIDDFYEIEDVNVFIDIQHDNDSEIGVSLIAPDNTRVELFENIAYSGADFNDTVLDDEASVSIVDGSAPFSSIFKPEGRLADFDGKNIYGTWTLEVTDDSNGTSGTLNSWSLITDLTDIAFYSECALDSDFNNILANSGWTTERSPAFCGLDPNQQYWYRAKARELLTWTQNSREDFETGTLTNTIVTDDGDVKISPSAVNLDYQPVTAIQNPSFESPLGWYTERNSPYIAMLLAPKEVWASDGDLSAAIVFSYDNGIYFGGDYAAFTQSVNWTNVDRLMFDYSCYAFNRFSVNVFIGGTSVWQSTPGDSEEVHLDQTVDVSDITGTQDLRLSVEFNYDSFAFFDAFFFWDNFRTYKKEELNTRVSGSMISEPVAINSEDTWNTILFDSEIPEGASLTIDILPETGSEPIEGYADIQNNTDISGLNERIIRLRASFLSAEDISISPVLHAWAVRYASVAGESNWSNIVSSH